MTRYLTYDEFQIAQELIKEKLADNDYRAAAMVVELKLAELETKDERLARARLYRNWRNSGVFGKDTKPCFEKAIAGFPAPAPLIPEAAHSEVTK